MHPKKVLLIMVLLLVGYAVYDITRKSTPPSPLIAALTEESFTASLAETSTPALVDFYADWCGPCKALQPTLNQIAESYQGRLALFRLDVDEAPKLSEQFNITGIPCLVLFKDGKEVDRMTGKAAYAVYENWLGKHL